MLPVFWNLVGQIEDRIRGLLAHGEKAFIPFFTAGDPDLSQCSAVLNALRFGGADCIEIGIPFSDPIADGPVIQASSQRALDRGTTPSGVLDRLSELDWASGPLLILMGYWNPILRYGVQKFVEVAAKSNVKGTILCDLTPEESAEWIACSEDYGLDCIFLAAPTSTDSRLDTICATASGFVYAVARTGVTGSGNETLEEAETLVRRIRQRTDMPVCVGFGIESPSQVHSICEFADGVIVGSTVVSMLQESWNGGDGIDEVVSMLSALKAATRL